MWLDRPSVILVNFKMFLSTKQQESLKNKGLLLTRSGHYIAYHALSSQEERAIKHGPVFCFYWCWGWGPTVLKAYSLLMNLKHKRGILKCEKRKKKKKSSDPNCQLAKSTKIAKTEESQWGEAPKVFARHRPLKVVAFFKMNDNQSLSQVLALQKSK